MVSGVRSAKQHLGCGAVEKDVLPNQWRVLKLRILLGKSARNLAAEGPDQRLQIDALHNRFSIAALGGRSQLRRAGERPTPIGHDKDDERDRAPNEHSHGAPYQARPAASPRSIARPSVGAASECDGGHSETVKTVVAFC